MHTVIETPTSLSDCRRAGLSQLLLPLNGCIRKEPDMTPYTEFIWMINWTLVGNAMPPRDPDDDDDDDEDAEDEQNKNDEPAVIREPDEDK